MPKILINEIDNTLPGTPDSYSNYAVLLAGFSDTTKEVAPRSVYEFTSAQTFKNTIGLCAPKKSVTMSGSGSVQTIYHYGNQMAYELLNLGYKVIYKTIETIDDLTDVSFWEEFRDRASYDFRFVSHGLLSSAELSDEQKNLVTKLADVVLAIEELERITSIANSLVDAQTTDYQAELAVAQNVLYQKAIFNFFDIATATETEREIYERLKLENTTVEAIDNKNGFMIFDSVAQAKEDDMYASFADAETGTRDEKDHYKSLLSGLVTSVTINDANGIIANLAKYDAEDAADNAGRGDCIALIELDENSYTNNASADKPEVQIVKAINEMSQINDNNGKYCAMTVPSVVYKMADNAVFENNKKFPGAFHYLACFISSLKAGFAEWYAAAGYTRGVSSYVIDHTSVKLGEIAINALEPRNITSQVTDPKFACNVIANFRGSYYLWGNRTAHRLTEKLGGGDLIASHFLNIRQLCTTVKKQLYVACRRFTFDPNSDTLWVNFVNAIKPTLELMKADQGIRDYRIQKLNSDKKATLKAKIRIIPIEAVEDFDLEVSLEDSFGETTAVVTE